ncbi:hypothetical protein AB0B10_25315 [Micromonospora arborensis]|uniref:hypothetical protein n=1 Tax=Micromonospora arborensis TaxID=2116518 RepID=UPI0033E11460
MEDAAASWPIDDIVATGDLAAELHVGKPTVSNWPRRYDDFPHPLKVLSTGPIYSRRQVLRWHDGRDWKTGRPRLS